MSGVKIGDKVVVIDSRATGGDYKNGDVGVVVFVHVSGNIEVQFDHYMYDQDFNEHYLYGSEYRVFQQHLVKEGQKTTAEGLKQVILSVRQEREQALSKLKDLNTQEAEAISQLNALGFSLFEEGGVSSSPSKTVLYAEDIEEDMTDPKNWKVGDFLEQHKFSFKATYTPIVGIEQGKWYTEDRDGESSFGDYNDMRNDFKFHSRPVK